MPRINIFLADDDPDDASLFSEIAWEIDKQLHVTHFLTCEALVAALGDSWIPDIIFLDLNMPPMTGQTCLARLRSKDAWKKIPVIIYSSASRSDIIQSCYASGADLYVVKPNASQKLAEIIRSAIKKFVPGHKLP
jgi:CheY-like chemotaxis protein